MSWDYDSSDDDYPTAVAAAAYSIQSLEDSKPRNPKKTYHGPDKSLNKTRIKAEHSHILPQKHENALSDETSKKRFEDPDIKVPMNTSSMSKRMSEETVDPSPFTDSKISFSDTDETNSDEHENPVLEKAPERAAPFVGRPPIFVDKHLNIGDSKIPAPKPIETGRRIAAKPGPADSMADAWEKEEMASIQERYESLRATIENWEIKKKRKADRKLEKIKGELDKRKTKAVESLRNERMSPTIENWEIEKKKKIDRKMEKIEDKFDKKRAKAAQSHRGEIKRIDEIAGGARAQAEENCRNKELKVKEKANKIRSTGKLPPTCMCF